MHFLVKSDLKLFLVVVFTCRGTGLENVIPGNKTQVGLEVARGNKDLEVFIQENDAAWLNFITTSAPKN